MCPSLPARPPCAPSANPPPPAVATSPCRDRIRGSSAAPSSRPASLCCLARAVSRVAAPGSEGPLLRQARVQLLYVVLLEQYLVLQPPDPALEVVVDGGEGPPSHRHEGEEGE